jgi:hypothetical protein
MGPPRSSSPEHPTSRPPALPADYLYQPIQIPRLCAGVYTAQSTLVNVGQAPVDNAALAWEVIEGRAGGDGRLQLASSDPGSDTSAVMELIRQRLFPIRPPS